MTHIKASENCCKRFRLVPLLHGVEGKLINVPGAFSMGSSVLTVLGALCSHRSPYMRFEGFLWHSFDSYEGNYP